MGKGDRKSKKAKQVMGTYGKRRPRLRKSDRIPKYLRNKRDNKEAAGAPKSSTKKSTQTSSAKSQKGGQTAAKSASTSKQDNTQSQEKKEDKQEE
ncbi:MAG: 30S ribosomal protein THX [Bacteroidales bacterium]|nr:30S ribosomal protein THX [Bacteroidales bacterium]MCF8336711.1 30S ribosomal protein THX [Bacteroidales bacterium]